MTAEQLNYKMRRAIGTYDNSLVISMADSCVKVANEALELKEAEHLNKLREIRKELDHCLATERTIALEIIDKYIEVNKLA